MTSALAASSSPAVSNHYLSQGSTGLLGKTPKVYWRIGIPSDCYLQRLKQESKGLGKLSSDLSAGAMTCKDQTI